MKIISFKLCPFVQRVIALLEAKNLQYDTKFIDLKNKPDWFLSISPNGQVPILITDKDTALFESDAIVEYIEEAYPALQPCISLEQKALNRAWSHLATKSYSFLSGILFTSDEKTIIDNKEKLDKSLDLIEKHMNRVPFFCGNEISLVDIAWLPLFHRIDIITRNTQHDMISDRPKIKKWLKAILGTGLASSSVAPDFEEIFIESRLQKFKI